MTLDEMYALDSHDEWVDQMHSLGYGDDEIDHIMRDLEATRFGPGPLPLPERVDHVFKHDDDLPF